MESWSGRGEGNQGYKTIGARIEHWLSVGYFPDYREPATRPFLAPTRVTPGCDEASEFCGTSDATAVGLPGLTAGLGAKIGRRSLDDEHT